MAKARGLTALAVVLAALSAVATGCGSGDRGGDQEAGGRNPAEQAFLRAMDADHPAVLKTG